jgi:hypothetical protein
MRYLLSTAPIPHSVGERVISPRVKLWLGLEVDV